MLFRSADVDQPDDEEDTRYADGGQAHAEMAGEGFGLTSMQQRAGAIGGEWQIDSKPGAGTRVSVRLPKRRA